MKASVKDITNVISKEVAVSNHCASCSCQCDSPTIVLLSTIQMWKPRLREATCPRSQSEIRTEMKFSLRLSWSQSLTPLSQLKNQ